MNPLLKTRTQRLIQRVPDWQRVGRITSVQGSIVAKLSAAVGEICELRTQSGSVYRSEVIGFQNDEVRIMPYETGIQLQLGDMAVATGHRLKLPAGPGLLGRVLNAFGEPIDGLGPLTNVESIPLKLQTPHALGRTRIRERFETGQRAIDGLLTVGQGQRIGLFAGSGVGKSTLLGQIAQKASSEINVVALIGERGREVVPFLQDALGHQGLQRSVVIVSTADESALARVRAAETAVCIADWYRQQSQHVLLMLDSLTRFAFAQRDIGLLLGEPPTSRGYTPSVFQKMASLLEHLGTSETGSITGILSVLVDGDDMNDPVADSARSILDGHVVLDRELANAGHFPAINILKSASRLFLEVTDPEHQKSAMAIRQVLAVYQQVGEMIQLGVYQPGSNPKTDLAIQLLPGINQFLQQSLNDPTSFDLIKTQMSEIATHWTNPVLSRNTMPGA